MKASSVPILVFLFLTPLMSAKNLVNANWWGVGISGYDPVAYFTDGKPEKGDQLYQSTVNGVIYRFASSQHKTLFDANPARYIPQFGGYCAYGVSNGDLLAIDPAAFQIINDKLFLQYSMGVMKKFNKDQSACLQKADSNWPLLVEKKGK